MYRIGIDVGGTFTDVVLVDEATGGVSVAKVLNSDSDRANTVVEGIRRVLESSGTDSSEVRWISHGTTITTNAVIERKGGPTALITNKGFRDVLEIGRFSRPPEMIYRIYDDKPAPLVPRYLRLEVDCRVDHTGQVLKVPDPSEIRQLASSLRAERVSSVAVCFLFSFLNPSHEQLVRDQLNVACPEVEVVLSSDIMPEPREFPRSSTTVFAAYIAPVLRSYLEQLVTKLAENKIRSPLYIFQSNGGVALPSVSLKNPATTLLSGPAGAVVGAAYFCERAGTPDVITMDIGGTSLDVCLVRGGKAELTTNREIEFFPVALPMLDVHSLGAGGGSLVSVDEVGRVHVGPESQGARPGPACYAMGGDRPTLTDVNLLLGYLNPDYFAGGELKLQVELARQSVDQYVAKPLGLSAADAAQGIHRVATNQIAEAIRAITIERGYDPREFKLVAFGGGGPVHAPAVALELGIETVIVPRHPGLFSARGIAMSDFTHDYVTPVLAQLSELDQGRLEEAFGLLESRAAGDLAAEGIPEQRQIFVRSLDMRYSGQSSELNVQVTPETLTGEGWAVLSNSFHEQHRQFYTYAVPGEPIELVSARLKAIGLIDKPDLPVAIGSTSEPDAHATRAVWSWTTAEMVNAPVYRREVLHPGTLLTGPALIEEASSSMFAPPGSTVTIDAFDNLFLTLADAK